MPHNALVKVLYRVHAGHRFLRPVVSHALSSRLPGSDLSQREQEFLQLLFAGNSNREIAQELAIKDGDGEVAR
jgi:DNA-binding NarL/FixJ family response regulator